MAKAPLSPSARRKYNQNYRKRVTRSTVEFNKHRKLFPDRVTIVAEGDSWFAYPSPWFVDGKKSNLVRHLRSKVWPHANFYSPSSSGDELMNMMAGDQRHHLISILKSHSVHDEPDLEPIDLLLMSGGGNDVVGKQDFERFIHYQPHFTTAKECVRSERLKRKVQQMGLAYMELLDMRDQYSPSTIIMTHTYDYPLPSLTGARFLGRLIKTQAWMKPFMDAISIPEELQFGIIKIFMNSLAKEFIRISKVRDNFIVVDTRGTLDGCPEHWLNEIHPTPKGFELIADKIYEEIIELFPSLAHVDHDH